MLVSVPAWGSVTLQRLRRLRESYFRPQDGFCNPNYSKAIVLLWSSSPSGGLAPISSQLQGVKIFSSPCGDSKHYKIVVDEASVIFVPERGYDHPLYGQRYHKVIPVPAWGYAKTRQLQNRCRGYFRPPRGVLYVPFFSL